jgi:hypothetical protein
MTKFALIGATAVSLLTFAAPTMAQEFGVVQEFGVERGYYSRPIVRRLPARIHYRHYYPSVLGPGFLDPRNIIDNTNIGPEFAPFG